MTPAARLAAAIEIVGLLRQTDQPADRLMRDYFRARRFAGSKDRRAIAERVFHLVRNQAHFAWRMGGNDPRRLAIASLLAEGADPQALFTGGYGPEPLAAEEGMTAIAATPGEPPLWVEGEFPQFLEGELTRAFGGRLLTEMAAFAERAPVDLRVNILKAARDEVLARLRADGFDAMPFDYPLPALRTVRSSVEAPVELSLDERRARPAMLRTPPPPALRARGGPQDGLSNAIRCEAGANLTAHPLFQSGAFEIQDAAAQIAAAMADARPGMRVLDLAAGAEGKALALAAAMGNRGEIVACDIRPAPLAELERAGRRGPGVTIIPHPAIGRSPPGSGKVPFDLVFIDAPCSGSGTWRRQPEAKWRLTPGRLAALHSTQDQLLVQAAGLAARLVYATCSILPCENQDRVAAFVAREPAFRHLSNDFKASPASTGTDGFFTAILARV